MIKYNFVLILHINILNLAIKAMIDFSLDDYYNIDSIKLFLKFV